MSAVFRPMIAKAVCSHWDIENTIHWVLDVSSLEEDSRIRKGHGPDVRVLRRIALNLVRQDASSGSLPQKRKRAGWGDAYHEEILGI